jgi:hypothetical protein
MRCTEFLRWMQSSLRSDTKFRTLGGNSYFWARYELGALTITLGSGNRGRVTDVKIETV